MKAGENYGLDLIFTLNFLVIFRFYHLLLKLLSRWIPLTSIEIQDPQGQGRRAYRIRGECCTFCCCRKEKWGNKFTPLKRLESTTRKMIAGLSSLESVSESPNEQFLAICQCGELTEKKTVVGENLDFV